MKPGDNDFTEIARLLSKDGSVHVTDELVNTVTSMIGACFGLLGTALLVTQAAVQHDVWKIVGFGIYGAALISLFVSSALHHGIDGSEMTNRRLRTYDYISVFLLIAGTITPVVLVKARNPIGWCVFGAIWAIAILGIALRATYHQLPRFVTNTLYIVLGWLAALVVIANFHIPTAGYIWLVAGGLIYSLGFAVFVLEKPNFRPGRFGFHELWHCFVIAGAFCHFMLMYRYIL